MDQYFGGARVMAECNEILDTKTVHKVCVQTKQQLSAQTACMLKALRCYLNTTPAAPIARPM